MWPDALRLTAIAAALALSALAGWTVQGWRADARVQSLKAAQAARDQAAVQQLASAERANVRRLQAAQDAADAAIAKAQASAAAASKQLEATRDQLATVARADRACLSATAVGVLNAAGHGPDAGSGLRLPTHTSSTATAPSVAASGAAGYASERAIADWIAQAQALYATCADRIEAIASWQQTISQTHLLADSAPQK